MNKIKQIIKKVEEYEDNNCFELKTSVVLYWLNEIQKEAINYTRCCKSDSELLECDNGCDWYSVGHQLNGHQQCRKCGKQKAF